tara:strand:- start:645 stop:941 length:297 start_codon:yes stop_codon:yes gene_type:complete
MKNVDRKNAELSDLIYNAVDEINYRYNMCIDAEGFFDPITSRFCTAAVGNNILVLDFPVVSTNESAIVSFAVDEGVLNTESITINNAFQLEINNKSFY